jgi:rubrerythrin
MAHIKYLHFAKIARAHGDEEVAAHFERTAAQEVAHALGHAELLFPKHSLDTRGALELAIEGETHEYTEMYPAFRNTALQEKQAAAAQEFDEQIAESAEHAEAFRQLLTTAEKRFAALTKVEERHAQAYRQVLDGLTSQNS